MTEASIVFRNADMSTTPKIYVDKMSAALELAAEFRNASTYVDIITRQDEVAYRWKNGVVEWDQNHAACIASQREPYDFVRKGDTFWDAESRMCCLLDALEYVEQIAKGNDNPEVLDAMILRQDDFGYEACDLIRDAHVYAASMFRDFGGDEQMMMHHWSTNSAQKYLRNRVEFVALSIHVGILI